MLKSELRELKTLMNEKIAALDELVYSDKVKIEGKNIEIDPAAADAGHKLTSEIKSLNGLLTMASMGSKMKSQYDLDPESESLALGARAAYTEAKTLSEAFVDSPEFKRVVESGNVNMQTPLRVESADICRGGFVGQKDVYSTMNPATYVRQFGSIQFDPMVPRAYRKTRVRDLFPVATTSSNLIDYFQVVGYASPTQGAKSVPDRNVGNTDFAVKPHTNLVFRSNQAPVRTLAHWEMAHRNVLADVPQLRSTIDNELLYGLQLEEDRQILNGSGANDELLGVLNANDIQEYTAPVDELRSDSIRRAMTKAVLAYYQPTGVVLHPNDWERIETQKGSATGAGGVGGGDGQYMLVTNISVGANATLWRQPIVETPAMAEGTFLTGAFGIGVQLYDRAQADVRTSEHHADTFIKNAVTILCEERLALAHKRPESMVSGSFSVEAS